MANKARQVLVTGGAGYIGTNVVLKLLSKGFDVIVVDNFSNSYEQHIQTLNKKFASKIHIYNFNLLDSEKLDSIFKYNHIDGVIHLAGKKYVAESFEKKDDYELNNVTLTTNLLSTMKRFNVKKIIFSSSITVYGKASGYNISENDALDPISPYANTKKIGEEIINKWCLENDGAGIVLRLSNPIGAENGYMLGDHSKYHIKGVLPYLVDAVKGDKHVTLNGNTHPTPDGTTIRDYIHVEDVADAFVLAYLKCGAGFNVYNVGNGGNGFSVLMLLNEITKGLNKTARVSFGPTREGDISIFTSDCSKVKKELGFTPQKSLKDMAISQIKFSDYLETTNKQLD